MAKGEATESRFPSALHSVIDRQNFHIERAHDGIIIGVMASRWGYYLLALASFWWIWANVMTTAISMRFYTENRENEHDPAALAVPCLLSKTISVPKRGNGGWG